MCSGGDTRALPRVGSPIRRSAGQRLFSTSPRLIAAVHVLHRLLTPRHPPRALNILTRCRAHLLPLCSFQGTRAGLAAGTRNEVRPAEAGRSLKTEQHGSAPRSPRATNPSGLEWCARTRRAAPGRRHCSRAWLARLGRGSSTAASGGLRSPGGAERRNPRKEVIQPQLPLRLPCYDFTPIADPTFDGCLPCGLAHRLRVLPTFVV